jgi:hypothetical protein
MLGTIRFYTHSLPLCVKIVLENLLWMFIYFCAESAKINEHQKGFSEHDFDAKRKRVSVKPNCA